MSHPIPARVAEVLVERAGEPLERGSGYLVAPGRVLTAGHVVAGAEAIKVCAVPILVAANCCMRQPVMTSSAWHRPEPTCDYAVNT